MLSAGTNVEWLRDDLGIIDSAAHSHDVAAQCDHTDGVVYVPALIGLGTPHWDYGARGTLLGLTRGSGRPQVVRAVLEGIAHRGADLLEAAEADYGSPIARDPDRRRHEPEPDVRAGAGRRDRPGDRGVAADRGDDDRCRRTLPVLPSACGVRSTTSPMHGDPRDVVEPTGRLDRQQWASAITRARGWIPDLSALDF